MSETTKWQQFKKLWKQYQNELVNDDIALGRAIMKLEDAHEKERKQKQDNFLLAIKAYGLEAEYQEYTKDVL